MSLESATFISGLDATNPVAGDQVKQGDDHLRLIKSVLQACFPNADKANYFPDAVGKSANYTILAADMNKTIVADATGGAFNLTLPTLAASDDGWSVRIVKSDSTTNAITIVGTVNGSANPTVSGQFQTALVVWSGSAWFLMSALADPTVFVSTDAGAAVGPIHDLYRNSASPAASDFIGALDFNGKDSGAAKQLYARIVAQITDPTAASEDAILLLQAVVAGTLTTLLQTTTLGVSTPQAALTAVDTPLAITGSTTANRPGSPTAGNVRYNTTLNGLEYWNGTAWIVLGQAPTVQRFLSGVAQTYTPSTGVIRIRVRMVGGGGGGGAQATNSGTNGADTSFGSWTAIHGNGGVTAAGAGGAGGTGGATGTGTLVARFDGANGGYGCANATTVNIPSGIGGSTPFGGGGAWVSGAVTGLNAKANTGSGGSGGTGTNSNSGGGGGAGEYVEFWVNNPGATTYTVGVKGTGGAAGGHAGGDGADGIIIIEEFYS